MALGCGLLASLLAPGSAAADPSFEARGSVEQVYVTGLSPGAQVSLYDGEDLEVATKSANDLGGALFREVEPGGGYTVGLTAGGPRSVPLQVLTTQSAPPGTDIYDQSIPSSGYGYLTTRDGVKLAIDVHPPQDVTKILPGVELPPLPSGPTPTLIEYSGYGYANPAGPESGISIIANLMGFTVVDVNMRGTGCSGGAFDFFEPLQSLDGYDVIETIANQPWVLHHEVGMMGISYGGISQLFTAATQPPSLAAISPLSVIDNTQTTLYPGGILNTGFALEWAKERVHDAEAASPTTGQEWAHKRIQEGDQTCAANQALHPEAVDLLKKVEENDHYKPEVADPLSPITFVDQIDVPTFMACQWTDEQTGGHCPTLAEALHRNATEVVHLHQRHPRRLARPGDVQPLVRLPPALRRKTAAAPRLRGGPRRGTADLPGSDGDTRDHAAAGSDPVAADLRAGAQCLRETEAGPDPLRQRRRRALAGPALPRLREVLRRIPGPWNPGQGLVPLVRTAV